MDTNPDAGYDVNKNEGFKMAPPRQTLGKRGEEIAVHYLIQRDYSIIARNWHCKFGELDIIARQNGSLVFIEVKTRGGDDPGNPFENITPAKRKRLIASVYAYLAEHHLDNVQWRMDAVGIALPRSGQPVIEHVEDALDW
jgi:putative endonuclease